MFNSMIIVILCSTLWRGYSNAFVVLSVQASVSHSVHPSVTLSPCEHDKGYFKPFYASSSNIADMLSMMKGMNPIDFRGQGHNKKYGNNLVNKIEPF